MVVGVYRGEIRGQGGLMSFRSDQLCRRMASGRASRRDRKRKQQVGPLDGLER